MERIRLWLCKLCLPLIALLISGCDGMSEELLPGEERVADNEPEITRQLLDSIQNITRGRISGGAIPRFNQPKSLGCFDAQFIVESLQDPELTQGLFAAPGNYPARVRFANATKFDDRKKDFRGMSIKVASVSGQPLWGEPGIQDFILNSYPALFAGTAEKFLAFVKAMEKGRVWSFFVNPWNWRSLGIVVRGREAILNPFDIRYWSTTPYRFGKDPAKAVKYSVRPCSNSISLDGDNDDPDRLTISMRRHLESEPACFDFMVQFQSDPKRMPIEDASVVWDEQDSPFRKVATIRIEQQSFETDTAKKACESISFNPWQSLSEHQPLGGINRIRKEIYAQMATFRGANTH
ncbi:MAG: catalase family protein [bacterium]